MNDEEHVHQLSIEDIQNISAMRHPDVSFDQIDLTTDEARFAMNHAISSQAVTAEEASVGNFTRRKLKKLNTWPSWEAGEHKQLNHFENLQMHGKPVARPEDAIVLRPHWQCQIKRDGARRSRNCCDGSPRSAPALKGAASTYSSCVEQPVQRMFFALAASMGHKACGGDTVDACAHSPPPDNPTFVSIDDAYYEWYLKKYNVRLDKSLGGQHRCRCYGM